MNIQSKLMKVLAISVLIILAFFSTLLIGHYLSDPSAFLMSNRVKALEASYSEVVVPPTAEEVEARERMNNQIRWGLFFLVVIAAGVGTIYKLDERENRKFSSEIRTSKALSNKDLKNSMKQLIHLSAIHSENFYPTMSETDSLVKNLNTLFDVMNKKSSQHQKDMAELEFLSSVNNLNKILGEEYYLAIMRNKSLWSNPEVRLNQALETVKVLNSQVMHSIQQINSSNDLELQVGVESIKRYSNQISPSSMLKK